MAVKVKKHASKEVLAKVAFCKPRLNYEIPRAKTHVSKKSYNRNLSKRMTMEF